MSELFDREQVVARQNVARANTQVEKSDSQIRHSVMDKIK
jgi:hypothetical protein